MKNSNRWFLGLGSLIFSLIGICLAQSAELSVEGQPVVTVNEKPLTPLPSQPYALQPGSQVCYKQEHHQGDKVQIYEPGFSQPLTLWPGGQCYAVPVNQRRGFFTLVMAFLPGYTREAVIVRGEGDVRGTEVKAGSADILLPSSISGNIVLWFRGGPEPLSLTVTSASKARNPKTNSYLPTKVNAGILDVEARFDIPAKELNDSSKVEVFKGTNEILYCGNVIRTDTSELEGSDDVLPLLLSGDKRYIVAVYTYLERAASKMEPSSRKVLAGELDALKEDIVNTYVVNTCQAE